MKVRRIRSYFLLGALVPPQAGLARDGLLMTGNQNSRVVNAVWWAGLVLLVLAAAPVAGFPADSPAGPPKP